MPFRAFLETSYIKPVPCFHSKPEFIERLFANTTFQTLSDSTAQSGQLFAPLLIAANEISDIVAGACVLTAIDLHFDPALHGSG